MKIAIASDLHLDFITSDAGIADLTRLTDFTGADYLFIAGDLAEIETITERRFFSFVQLFNTWLKQYKKVFLVCGNHEFYTIHGTPRYELIETYYEFLERFDRRIVLLDETCNYLRDGERIIPIYGATLWTDFGPPFNRPRRMLEAPLRINDYRYIYETEDRKITPENVLEEHNRHLNGIELFLEESADCDQRIIMTHHGPSENALHPDPLVQVQFRPGDHLFKNRITQNRAISNCVWIHGHVHYPVDMTENGCKIVCNPLGYPGEDTFKNFQIRVIDV